MGWSYKEIYAPNHPNARSNGCVLEHRLVAEHNIGRPLKGEEVVHHIDEDRTNNNPNNLIVFVTHSDHARYHRTGIMIEAEPNVFFSPQQEFQCPTCSKVFYDITRKYCSDSCIVRERKVERPSREELLVLIKSKPFTQIGNSFGVSDNAVRKWCKAYELPYKKKDIASMGV